MRVPSCSAFVLLALSGCALSGAMPPIGVTRAAAASLRAPSPLPVLPTARTSDRGDRIAREYDAASNQTRVSVTTHRGVYFLWIQHPRLTFFYEFAGATPAQVPPSVFLIIRTQSPQVPATNRLSLVCDGVRQELGVTPTFTLEPGAFTSNRQYMYELPLEQFAHLVACHSVTIALDQVKAPFKVEQLEALRGFAGRLGGP